jgi:hypothetical protein
MRNSKIKRAGHEIASGLINSEAAIDRATAHVAKLVVATLDIGSAARLAGGETQPVIEYFAEATRCLVTARGLITRGHEMCADKRENLAGLREAMFGDTFPCPESASDGEVVPLSIVAA